MPAGPSEVLVIADDSAVPAYVAADLLAQAEHGVDSQSVLVTTSQRFAEKVIEELNQQLPVLPRVAIAGKAIENSYIVVVFVLVLAFFFGFVFVLVLLFHFFLLFMFFY